MTQIRQQASEPLRANVLGVGIHAVDVSRALEFVNTAVDEGRKGYVCVTGVHGVMEAQTDPSLRKILNTALLVVPDGMPMVWVGKMQGLSQIERVFGPEYMLAVCEASVSRGYKHFLYGGNEGVAEQLRVNLERRFPGLRVVGTYTPPFRPLNTRERGQLQDMVRAAQPDFFWVGLSTPKQEKFMAEYLPLLQTKIMFGVGAAFDVHTGRLKDCSGWMKQAGLQWLHRLWQEPRRLWRRYLVNNPRFIVRIASQLSGIKNYDLGAEC